MIGNIRPYKIRYKSLRKSKFKIDPKTFRILTTNDEEAEIGESDAKAQLETPRSDPHLLTIQIPPKSHEKKQPLHIRGSETVDFECDNEELLARLLH